MRLNPDYLVVFSTVAELGSVSRAAERLNLSQPAISASLKSLQELVGEPLYERHPRGITLTSAGMTLLPAASAVARGLTRASELILEQRGQSKTEVRLGVSWTLSVNQPVQLLEQMQAQKMTNRVVFVSDHTQALIQQVAAGQLHAALAIDASQNLPEGLEAQRFGEEEVSLIALGSHAIHGMGYVSLKTVESETLLWAMPGSSVRRRAEAALNAAGVTAAQHLELGGFLAVREALLKGLGMAFLPRSMVGRELAAGWLTAVGLEVASFTLGYHMISPPQALLSTATRSILNLVK
jgi:LysR family transcriptional regulator, low CO2-responsive transcriptional regulator